MVNVAGSRLVLNLRGFNARNSVDLMSFSMFSSDAALTTPRRQSPPVDEGVSSEDPEGDIDLEMYSIERDCQQLGTKLLH